MSDYRSPPLPVYTSAVYPRIVPSSGSNWLPSLCSVTQDLWIDFGLWFIKNANFEVLSPSNLQYLEKFLTKFPERSGWRSVRRMTFSFFGKEATKSNQDGVLKNSNISFMTRCGGIVAVTLKFSLHDILQVANLKFSPLPNVYDTITASDLISIQEMVHLYILKQLLELENSRTIYITANTELWTLVHDEYTSAHIRVDGSHLFLDLARHLQVTFRESGRTTRVIFVHDRTEVEGPTSPVVW